MDWRRFLPRYWFQNTPTSKAWDTALNEALDTGDIQILNAHQARVGPYVVWIENWPYAYGYRCGVSSELLPTVKTRLRLRDAVVVAI